MKKFFVIVFLTSSLQAADSLWPTCFELGMSSALFWVNIPVHLLAEHTIMNYPDASAETTEFVHEQLKLHQVPNYRKIAVKVGNNFETWNNGVIVLLQSGSQQGSSIVDRRLDELRKAVTAEEKAEAEYNLLMLKAIIAHEAQHAIHNDGKSLLRLRFIVPLTTYITSLFMEQMAYKMAPKMSNLLRSDYTKIAKGVILHFSNIAIYTAIYRAMEQRADNGVPDEKRLLNAFKDFLLRIDNNTRAVILKEHGEKFAPNFDSHGLIYEIFSFSVDQFHPSPRTRVRKIDERLQKLEQENQSGIPESSTLAR